MDEGEPRVRRRGMFFHVETPELDSIEHDNAEGISIRQVPTRKPSPANGTTSPSDSVDPDQQRRHVSRRRFKSASATGTRQRAQMNR